jgi:hypothetical protein
MAAAALGAAAAVEEIIRDHGGRGRTVHAAVVAAERADRPIWKT